MGAKNETIRKMQAQLNGWDIEIETLTVKAHVVKADVKSEFDDMIASLKINLAAARQKSNELQQAGEDAWENLKSGLDGILGSLGDAVKAAKSHLK